MVNFSFLFPRVRVYAYFLFFFNIIIFFILFSVRASFPTLIVKLNRG